MESSDFDEGKPGFALHSATAVQRCNGPCLRPCLRTAETNQAGYAAEADVLRRMRFGPPGRCGQNSIQLGLSAFFARGAMKDRQAVAGVRHSVRKQSADRNLLACSMRPAGRQYSWIGAMSIATLPSAEADGSVAIGSGGSGLGQDSLEFA